MMSSVRCVLLSGATLLSACRSGIDSGEEAMRVVTPNWQYVAAISTRAFGSCDTIRIARPTVSCAQTRELPREVLRALADNARMLVPVQDQSSTAAARHAMALIELAAAADSTDRDRAIRLLREASSMEPDHAEFRIDLSAALLVRYAEQRQILDVLEAVDLTNPLVEVAKPHASACWNHIVGLAWLAARHQALSVRQRCTAACTAEGCRVPALVDDAPNALADAAMVAGDERWTDAAWDHATDVLLPMWAARRRLGDARAEEQTRRLLEEIDTRLRRRATDSSVGRVLADALQWPPSSTRGGRYLRALELYGDARRLGVDSVTFNFEALADSIRSSTQDNDELRRWTEQLVANRALTGGRPREALERYSELIKRRPHAGGVAAGRLRFSAALAKMAQGDQLAALDDIERYASDCATNSRNECALAGFAMASGIAALVSDDERTLRHAHAALSASVAPLNQWRWSLLSRLRQIAEEFGLLEAAGRLQLEAVAVAEALNRPDLEVQDLVLHARARARAGDHVALKADLDKMRPLIALRLGNEDRRFHLADLAHLEGEYLLATHQPGAGGRFDLATRLMSADTNVSRQLRPQLSRARADLADADTARSLHRLDSLLRVLASRGTGATFFAQQRLLESARTVAAVAVPALRQAGDPAALLAALTDAPFINATLPTAPGDIARLDLAVRRMGDSVLVWSRGERGWRVRAVLLPSQRLRPEHSPRDSATLGELYELLIGPEVAAVNRRVNQLRIDARGDLAAVPWAALYDRWSRQFLVERFAVWQTDDLRVAPRQGRLAHRATSYGQRVMIVNAAPLVGPRALPGAREEVQRVAAIWGDQAKVMSGDAGAEDLLSQFAAYDVVHFAGHAVLDERSPERSYLALSGPRRERIEGRDLSALRLPNTSLVVLAACDTRATLFAFRGNADGQGGGARSGLESLAHAFRAAGARHVLGAAWPIDDMATAVLMEHLHDALREGRSVSDALRVAQLAGLRSPDPALRSPRVWAAFQLLGS